MHAWQLRRALQAGSTWRRLRAGEAAPVRSGAPGRPPAGARAPYLDEPMLRAAARDPSRPRTDRTRPPPPA